MKERPCGFRASSTERQCFLLFQYFVGQAKWRSYHSQLLEHVCLFTTLSGCAMKYTHLLASLVLTSCLIGSLARPGTDQGTGKKCVKTIDADGGPKCPSSQIALCCDTSQTSQNCNAASGTSCKDLYRTPRSEIQPFCCDQMDMPGCVNIESPEHKGVSCTTWAHPSQERFCCAKAGVVNDPILPAYASTYGEGQNGGFNCEDLYDMPKCPKNRPISFCC